jgi:hypothetical protein
VPSTACCCGTSTTTWIGRPRGRWRPRDGGALLGYFGNASHVRKGFTKFIVADESHLRRHVWASAAVGQSSPPNRDIIKMFDGLSVSDSFLLQNGLREILFRKGGGGRPII